MATAAPFPAGRPRRLRTTPAMRALVAQTRPAAADLVLPLFVREGLAEPAPIASMPGVVQHSRDSLRKAAVEAVQAGVGGLMLFGVPSTRDATGTGATDDDGILNVAIRDVVAEVGDATVVMSDLCLDEFTDHGHCGVLDRPTAAVDNDATLVRYAEMGLAQAAAGAHVLGLSGMMDGQVGVVRAALDADRLHRHRDPGLHREVRLGVLRPVPRGRRVDAGRRPAYLPAGPGQRRRGAARARAGPGRGRRHRDGQAGPALPRRPAPGRRRGCPARRTGGGLPGVRRVRDGRGGLRATAGWTASAPSSRP